MRILRSGISRWLSSSLALVLAFSLLHSGAAYAHATHAYRSLNKQVSSDQITAIQPCHDGTGKAASTGHSGKARAPVGSCCYTMCVGALLAVADAVPVPTSYPSHFHRRPELPLAGAFVDGIDRPPKG
jgi:hypothetical protein